MDMQLPLDIVSLLDEQRAELESEALLAGQRAGEAFAKSKYSTADYWLCIEFKLQRIHDDFCRRFGIDRKCQWSEYRQFISRARIEWIGK